MNILFIDESKRKKMILIGVIVPMSQVPRVRKYLARMRLPRQRSVHFVNESDSRRRTFLDEVYRLNIRAVRVSTSLSNELLARELAVRKLVDLAMELDVGHLVFETDESMRKRDATWIREHLAHRAGIDQLSFEHRARHEEPILWAADAFAWASSRGGEWERRICDVLIRDIELDL
jgi:hypothetical protein